MRNNEYEKPTNVLMVYAGYTTTAEILKLMLNEYVRDKNIELQVTRDYDVTRKDLVWSDVVVLVRGASKAMMNISKAAYKAKRYTILYLDDDLLGIFSEKTNEHKFLSTVLKNINCFWTSNKHIAEKYRLLITPNTRIVNEVVLEPWKKLDRVDNLKCKEARLVYAGSPSHKNTIEKLIIPALNIVNKSGKRFKMYFIGFNEHDFPPVDFNMEVFKWCKNMDEYRAYIIQESIQIGLAPLLENDFTKCKFYNKYVEYTKVGLVGIYSDVEPYNWIIDNNSNGLLVNNTVADWAQAIMLLIDDMEGLDEMKKKAQSVMEEKLNMPLVYSRIDKSIPELQKYHIDRYVNYYKSMDWRLVLHMIKTRVKEVIYK